MERGVFDIYQTPSGYTAVDHERQRRVLEALAPGAGLLQKDRAGRAIGYYPPALG